jgi:hypothetical protein
MEFNEKYQNGKNEFSENYQNSKIDFSDNNQNSKKRLVKKYQVQ